MKETTALPYIKYDSDFFFAQLIEATSSGLLPDQRMMKLRDVFRRVIEQCIAETSLNFAGMFAKTDYVLRQHSVPQDIVPFIHAARNSLFSHNRQFASDEFPHNLKGTCLLVSHIFGNVSIPTSLNTQFPSSDKPKGWGRYDHECIRVIVSSWDDDLIHVIEEHEGEEFAVCYGQSNTFLSRNGKFSWSYLKDILSEGCQLNLVRVRIIESVMMPELIIYEPDYLINVTTIASCFESYAESPYVALLAKVRPFANTMPIHLGNLAGKYLDDAVHGRDIPFADGIMDFFHQNSLALVTCSEFFDRDSAKEFYSNAQQQKRNIDLQLRALHQSAEYADSDVLLEPSFYSSVLGIQGRMDFLVNDDTHTIIIEQKSGKANFPFSAKEQHLVQLMLYRALLTYQLHSVTGNNSKDESFMLMYSRYPNGLINTAHMPELMLRSIRMRNLLAYNDMKYAEEGFCVMDDISADSLNEKQLSGKLWDGYIRPQINDLLRPLHSASQLERAYYHRFMQFLAKEQMLSKIGNKIKECSGFASVWHDTLEDKRMAGNIYDSLSIDDFEVQDTYVSSLRLRFNENDETSARYSQNANFRIGDIVILYPYHRSAEPLACQQIVHRATITNIDKESVELKLRNQQTNSNLFSNDKETFWAIEHDLMEVTESALYRAMHSFLSASQRRRDIVLCQRPLDYDKTIVLRGNYGSFNTLVSGARQARDMFFVIGPPGTGKTSHGLVNILKEELLDPDGSVLLLSYTNRAVDEICSKLIEHSIDFVRIGSEASCPVDYRNYLLPNQISAYNKAAEVRQMLLRQRVFCATTASINGSLSLLSLRSFSLAIIDEASQILEPHLIALLSARCTTGEDSISRFVFIGDHKQLPAVVQQSAQESAVHQPELQAIGLTDCRRSLFERLLGMHANEPDAIYMLTRQGRMHRDIADFPNHAFYAGKLDVVPLAHQLIPNINGPRVQFVPTPSSNQFSFDNQHPSDKTNQQEAVMIAAKVVEIYNNNIESFSVDQTIGIIVPYRNQITTIRNAIDRYGIKCLHDIAIDTVERFQGSQRDYILYGFTIRRAYQLNFLTSTSFIEDDSIIDRKLNVAMTRARLQLIIFGNPELLRLNPLYSSLIDYCTTIQ